MLALLMATLNVNVAANVVSPANDFSNLSPRSISFRTGGLITCFMGIRHATLEADGQLRQLHFRWLVGYSGFFLDPIAGVLICDYFIVRKKLLSCKICTSVTASTNINAVSIGKHWPRSLRGRSGVRRLGRPAAPGPVQLRVVRWLHR